MNRFLIALATAGVAVTALPTAASAAPWTPLHQREANIFGRIQQGVRSGALTRDEAYRLKVQFNALEQREYDYRRSNGRLDAGERRDLERRFDALSARVYNNKHDWQRRR